MTQALKKVLKDAGLRARDDRHPWIGEIIEKAGELLQLKENWNSYGGKPVQKGPMAAALAFIENMMRTPTPKPQMVPTSMGGVQLEWHEHGIDIEIEFYPNGGVGIAFEDLELKQEYIKEGPGAKKALEWARLWLSRIITRRARPVEKREVADNTEKFDGVAMRRFWLCRVKDETGISRTGRVLEGVVCQDGQVIIQWRPPMTSIAVYKDMKTFMAIHVDCHPSCSQVVWIDSEPGEAMKCADAMIDRARTTELNGELGTSVPIRYEALRNSIIELIEGPRAVRL